MEVIKGHETRNDWNAPTKNNHKSKVEKIFQNLYADSESPVEAQEEGLTQLAVGIVIKIIFINVLTPCTLDGHWSLD